jgi:hypothetical protein
MGLHVLQEVVAIAEDLFADMAGMHDKNSRKGGMGWRKSDGVARSSLASLEMYSTMITKFNYFLNNMVTMRE